MDLDLSSQFSSLRLNASTSGGTGRAPASAISPVSQINERSNLPFSLTTALCPSSTGDPDRPQQTPQGGSQYKPPSSMLSNDSAPADPSTHPLLTRLPLTWDHWLKIETEAKNILPLKSPSSQPSSTPIDSICAQRRGVHNNYGKRTSTVLIDDDEMAGYADDENNGVPNNARLLHYQRLVRDVVDNFTGISTENDALTVPSVDVRSAQQYALGNVAGPTLVEGQTPLFLEGTVKSEWNADVITLLAVHARMEAYRTSVSGKDEGMPFFTTLVSNRIGRLCTIRHKYAEKSVNGALETAQERGVRIAAGQAAQREKSRTDGRRYKKYKTRLLYTTKMVSVCEERRSPRIKTWQKLQSMVEILGAAGMSDEEDAVDKTGRDVLRVVRIPWRRMIGDELLVIDQTKRRWPELFDRRGAKPRERVRDESAGERSTSLMPAFVGKPKSFYAPEWLDSLVGSVRARLKVLEGTQDTFDWFTEEELEHAHDH